MARCFCGLLPWFQSCRAGRELRPESPRPAGAGVSVVRDTRRRRRQGRDSRVTETGKLSHGDGKIESRRLGNRVAETGQSSHGDETVESRRRGSRVIEDGQLSHGDGAVQSQPADVCGSSLKMEDLTRR